MHPPLVFQLARAPAGDPPTRMQLARQSQSRTLRPYTPSQLINSLGPHISAHHQQSCISHPSYPLSLSLYLSPRPSPLALVRVAWSSNPKASLPMWAICSISTSTPKITRSCRAHSHRHANPWPVVSTLASCPKRPVKGYVRHLLLHRLR